MKKTVKAFTVAATLLCASAGAYAQNLTEIKVSYQPALYWSLPFYIASEKGWWAELGLKPTFSTFPAGVPQIAASASKSWDVGGTGSVPAVLCKVRFNILTIIRELIKSKISQSQTITKTKMSISKTL